SAPKPSRRSVPEVVRADPDPDPDPQPAPPPQPQPAPPPQPARQEPPTPPSFATSANPLTPGPAGVSLTLDELCGAAGLSPAEVDELKRFSLVSGRIVAGTEYFDEEDLVVANLAARFGRFGIEPRHLRMYKTAAEREAGFFEQLIVPLLKQRNPQARHQAVENLAELARLGQGLRASLLRSALRDHVRP
ncbi:MAG: hypothetical protein ACYCZM_10430, partial [Acidimicrobiales bacterium]